MSDAAIIERLDELIAATKAASREWLDMTGVAEYLGYSPEYTRQKIVTLPDFPTPSRLNNGHPRWLRDEVRAWMLSQARS